MQIGLRLHDAKQLPLKERLEEIRKQGFVCGHLALSKVITENSVANPALTPGYAMYLKNLFAKNEIDIAVLGCYLNLANPDQEQLAVIKERYMANIRFAAHLGCGVVGTETGAPNTEYSFEPACHSEEALEIFIQNLKPIVAYAEKMGVIVAIEPVYKHIVCNPKRARYVLDTIQSPNLQIILDPVNLLFEGNYQDRDAIISEAITLLGKDVAVVHLKDFIIENGMMKSVAAGTGMMNYEHILQFIKKDKPFIHTTLENTTPDNAVSAREYLEKIYQSI
ncbi:sugar phosphate isomerase/epimerase family protein [Anaerosporobacter faecicola]|uniref:sugar phosphate isomerase/epimerase family protein n=1 Tax=Anaerosporobacter faecicola TaxID=2718714 RepID=UPI00143BA7CD|nr:sugar phosphate isomerase/epimerase family protein [Anaerosporobacter faecicola]